jgi:nitric oxide dioxygenase
MTTDQKELIKATIPVLKESGVLLTTHFYQRVFAHNSELKNVFNMGNQQNGRQPTALATAVLAYAQHIDDPSVLLPTLHRIGHKHTSLDIRPEHYALIGRHLIAAIGEVLGDTATPALLDAWTAAYQQLASLMMGIEAGLYAAQVDKPGGWTGWRPFVVRKRLSESELIQVFHLYPADGGPVADHLPGQYLSVRLLIPESNLLQPRQYGIANAPNGLYYAISVKRETGENSSPYGMISNRLLEFVQEGDRLELSAPAGEGRVGNSEDRVAAVGKGRCPMATLV